MTQALFDAVYRVHADYYGFEVRPEFAAFIAALPAGALCLDLGAGQGRTAVFAARAGKRVHAVDYSPVAVEQLAAFARREGLPITTERADVTALPATPDRYDAVFLISTLSHFRAGQVPGVVETVQRSLKPGGQVFVESFTTDDPGYRHAPDASETTAALTHYFAPGALREAFAAFRIDAYDERMEDDLTHGPAHRHGVALLVAARVE